MSVRHYAKRVKSAERTNSTTDKTYKTQARRRQRTDRDRQPTGQNGPANARRNQLAGGTSYRGIVRLRCSHSWQVSPYDSGGRFIGGSLAEAGLVSALVRWPPRARRCGGNRAGDDAVRTHAFNTHVGGLARRVGIQIGECPIVIAGVKPHDGLGAGCCGRSRMCRCRSRTARA